MFPARLPILALLTALMLTGCSRSSVPLSAEFIQKEVDLATVLLTELLDTHPEIRKVCMVLPPPLPGRDGEAERQKALQRAGEEKMATLGGSFELVHPAGDELSEMESRLYLGDFPVELLERIRRESRADALLCFKGVPVGDPARLDALARDTFLGGVATQGAAQVEPLLASGRLHAALLIEDLTVRVLTRP